MSQTPDADLLQANQPPDAAPANAEPGLKVEIPKQEGVPGPVSSKEKLHANFGRQMDALRKDMEDRKQLFEAAVSQREQALQRAQDLATPLATHAFDALRAAFAGNLEAFSKKLDALSAKADAYRGNGGEPQAESEDYYLQYAQALEEKAKDWIDLVPANRRETLEKQLVALTKVKAQSDLEKRKHMLVVARRAELVIDRTIVAAKFLPDLLGLNSPTDLHKALKDGYEHPRFLVAALLANEDQINQTGETRSETDRLAEFVPFPVRDGWKQLQSETIPATLRPLAEKAMRQTQNRFFNEAGDTIAELVKGWPKDGPQELRATFEQLSIDAHAEASSDRERLKGAQTAVRETLDEILDDSEQGDRHAYILEKKALLDLFLSEKTTFSNLRSIRRDASGGPKPPNAYDPMLADIPVHRDGVPVLGPDGKPLMKTVVIKFESGERSTRQSVLAGTGVQREMIAFQHNIGAGFDNTPLSVARNLEGYGRVAVMELVDDAQDCSTVNDWYEGNDDDINPSLVKIAVEDYLLFRTDGQARNLLINTFRRLLRIDAGSEFADPALEPESSVARQIMVDEGREIPASELQRIKKWRESKAYMAFMKMLEDLPDDTSAYRAAYEQRIDDLIQAAEKGPVKRPPYTHTRGEADLGKRFARMYPEFQKYRAEKRAAKKERPASPPPEPLQTNA